MTEAGKLNAQIEFQTATKTKLADGQESIAWATTFTPWACVRSPSGKELIVANQRQLVVDKVVETHWEGFEYSPSGRFLFKGQIFNILWCQNVDNRDEHLFTYCKVTQ